MKDYSVENQIVELREIAESRYFGKYRGIVTKIEENDEKLGVITALVPEIIPDCPIPSITPCVPFAGKDFGFVALPKVGEGIFVEFEAGDLSRPLWTGYWWANAEIPKAGDWEVITIVSRTGNTIVLDDKNSKIEIFHSKGPKFSITSDEILLQVNRTKLAITGGGVSINDGTFQVKT